LKEIYNTLLINIEREEDFKYNTAPQRGLPNRSDTSIKRAPPRFDNRKQPQTSINTELPRFRGGRNIKRQLKRY